MTAFTRPLVSEAEIAIVGEAIEAVPKADDQSFRETDLIDEVVKRMEPTGALADRRRRARVLIEAHNRQDNGDRLFIPGVPPRPPVPPNIDGDAVTAILDLMDRGMEFDAMMTLVRDHHPELDVGQALETFGAAIEQQNWNIERESRLNDLFFKWDTEQRAIGRPVAELIFGNFIRETGLLVAGVKQ